MTAVDKDLLARFDLNSPEYAQDPYPYFDAIRETDGIFETTAYGGIPVLATYQDVLYLYERTELFSSRKTTLMDEGMGAFRLIPEMVDPPDHTVYKHLLLPLFSPPAVARLEAQIRSTAEELFAGMVGRGGGEFVNEVSIPLPTSVFVHLMGWPESLTPQFLDWADKLIRGLPGADETESRSVQMGAAMEASQFFSAEIQAGREGPKDDLIGYLVQQTFDGQRPLTDEEILSICVMLLLAGLDTVKTALANAVCFLATSEPHRRELREDRSLIPAAIEELLRYEAPANGARIMNQTTVYRGREFKKDELVCFLVAAACRDGREFPNPDRVDFHRQPNRHLAFGAGPHRCLGIHLARTEMRIALETIFDACSDFELEPGTTPARHMSQIMGVSELQLRVKP